MAVQTAPEPFTIAGAFTPSMYCRNLGATPNRITGTLLGGRIPKSTWYVVGIKENAVCLSALPTADLPAGVNEAAQANAQANFFEPDGTVVNL